MNKTTRNILFSSNDKVFDGLLTCILSILKRSEEKDGYHFYILTMDVTHLREDFIPIQEEKINFLQQVVWEYGQNNRIIKFDVTELYEREFSGCPNEGAYCSPYTLLRLLIDLLPNIPEKILYLDADIMLNRDIRLLYDMDVEDYEYAAARDHYGKYLLNPNYINAGVLLFNMKKMRETKLLEKSRELIKTKKLMFADQSAIYRSTTRKKMLPQRYNDQKFLHKHTIIRHFSKRLFYLPYPHTENIKQWHVSKVYSKFHYDQFDDIFYEYIYLKGKFEHELYNTHILRM